MALADDIRALRDRVLADLRAAHDYYAETKAAWRIVHKVVETGHTFTVRNTVTGTVTTQRDLAHKARGYVAEQLAETTFQQFIAVLEAFFFDLLRLWLIAHPKSLDERKVDFQAVLNEPNKDSLIALVVGREVNDVLHGPPGAWFQYLEKRVNLGCPSADEIERIGEAKASRDVLVHNRGVANKAYEAKAGNAKRYNDGQRIEIPEGYHRRTWELIQKLVTDISDAAIAKAL